VLALLLRHLQQVGTVVEHLAAGDHGRWGVEDAHDRLRGDRLAGAGLAEHGERLAGVEV
jgi:hypothetical protein